MARVKKKKKPLRGSIRQNLGYDASEGWLRWFGFWPRLAFLVLSCVALIMLAGWVWHGQWPREQRKQLKKTSLIITQRLGFAVEDVIVEGRNYTDKQDILDALAVRSEGPIYAFDPHKAYGNIMKLPWVKSASILRSLPNKIIVSLNERKPVARWQQGKTTTVIDVEGEKIPAAAVAQFPNLPLIVGDVKPEQTQTLLAILNDFPMVSQRLKAAVRVAGRRWNLHIHPHITIRLPQQNARRAMTRLEDLIKKQNITERGVKSIDLRLPEKVFIEPIAQDDTQHSGDQ